MAKKETVDFDELNLDDIDFGGDFDFGTDGEIRFDADDDRSPVNAFTSSVKDGMKDRIMDRGLIRRLLSFALPKGYSQAFNAYDSLTNGVADIYKDNAAEMQPYMRKTNQLLARSNPVFKRMLPKAARQALEDSESEANDWSSSREDELTGNIAGIDKLLGMQAREKLDDSITTAARDVRERKQFKTQIGVSVEMGKALGRLVQYQDTVLINYHRKSLELKYRHLDVSMRTHHASEAFFHDATDLLKAVGKNTALPDFVKMRNVEFLKENLRHRLANNVIGSAANFASKHLGSIKKNLSDSLGATLSGINMAGQMAGPGMSRSAMAGQAVGGLVSSAGADFIEYIIKESLTKLNLGKEAGAIRSGGRFLQDKLSGISQRINDFARSETKATGLKGQAQDWLKRQLDSYTITDKINGGGVMALDEQAKFDNLFHKTVVEIIPGQLSSMEKWLRTIATGEQQEEHAYSHYTGGFVTRSTLNQQHIDIGLKAGAGDAVRRQLDTQLRVMEAESLSPKARRVLRARLMTDMSSNRDFEAKNFARPESWTNADPEVAEELVEFFAEKYGVGMDGEYDDDEDAKERRTKSRAEYLDLAPRLVDYTGRMAGLAEVIGRRSWRELGLAKYDGRSGDTIDTNAVYDRIANEGGDEFTVGAKKEEEKADPFTFSAQGLKDGINARADLQRKKMMEAEAEQKRLAEEARLAAEGVRVDVDAGHTRDLEGKPVTASIGNVTFDESSMEKLSAVLSQSMNNEYEIVLPETLETVDTGTHDRLDGLVGMLDSILSAIKANDPCACEGRSPADRFRRKDPDELEGSDAADGMSHWARLRDDALEYGRKGKQYAKDRGNQARQWLEGKYDDNREQIDAHRDRLMDVYEYGRDRTLGAIDTGRDRANEFIDAHRDQVLEPIETGKERAREGIELGRERFNEGVETGRDMLREGIEKGRERLREEWEAAPDRIEQGKERLREGLEDGKDRLRDGIEDGREWLRENKDPARERLREGMDKGREYLKDGLDYSRERLRDGIEIGKEYLKTREGDHREWFTDGFETGLKYGGGGGQGGEGGEGPEGEGPGPGKGSARSRIWGGIKGLPGKAFRGLGRYIGWSYRKVGEGTVGAAKLGYGAAKLPFTGIKGLGVADVHVQGDPDPALTARDIRRGFYFDVNTKKVITEIKDITGPVRNRDGEMVLTQEDFDKGLMTGDGESLAGWGLRKGVSLGVSAIGLTGRYLSGSYGLMGRLAKGAFNLAYDQFVQFDAYFPGDEEPRIRSSLMKKGFYRDADGAPLKSLKDIKGPVYDIEDNEVISQEELDKYKSLYTRNGSLLFTVGRGLTSATAWAGDLAKRGAIGYAKMVGKFYKGLWRGAKAVGRGIKNKLGSRFGFKEGSAAEAATGGMYGGDDELHTAVFEVGMEQLNVQRGILDLLRTKFASDKPDKWDLDGDGDRDNSWKDILSRRKEAKEKKEGSKAAAGGGEEIVKALDKLGKNLEESIDVLGDRVEESNEDGLLDQAADIGQVMDGWNGPDGGDGGDRRGRRGKRGARGGKRGGRMSRIRGRIGGVGSRIASSRAGGMLVRGGIMAGEGALALGGTIMGSSMMTGLGTAAMAAGTTALGWLGAAAAGIGTILSAPVVLAAAAIAAVGYVGYSWYKSSQAKSKPLFYLRMTQYGVDPTTESRVKQMLALEELLLPGVTFSGDKASIDASKVSMPELLKILEIEEGEDTRLRRALKWLAGRFRPVFLAHVGAMKKTVKSTKLSEADQLVDGSVIKEFLEIVDLKGFEKVYNDMFMSPFDTTLGFGGTLDCDASDVEDAFKLVKDRIEEKEKPDPVKSQDAPVDPKKEEDKLAEGAAVAAAAVKAAEKKKAAEDNALDIGGVVTSGVSKMEGAAGAAGAGLLGAAAGAAAVAPLAVVAPPGGANMTQLPLPEKSVSQVVDRATKSTATEGEMKVPLANAQMRAADPLYAVASLAGGMIKKFYQTGASRVKTTLASLDIPMAVRFLEYGLTSFDSEKCKQLQQVEDLYWDFLRFNGYDNALIEGDLVGLEDTVISFFTPTGGNPQNVLMWLRYRFMPTFLQYAISVRRRLPGDVRQAPRNLTSQLMREVLIETTQAVDSDSGNSVWLNMPSPWRNYPLGKDASVATPYIDALPKELTTLMVDGFKDMLGINSADQEAPIKDSRLYNGSPNQQNEDQGLFGNAVSSVKKFFGFGEDSGGTAAGANSSSGGGQYGMSGGGEGTGGGIASGPPAPSVGAQVSHPGGGTGGDINSLPNNSGDGWEAMKGIIVGAAKMAGFDPFIAANVAAVESRFKPRAGAGSSSAKGLYQFVNGTWREMLRKYGKKYGIAPNTHQFDPRANALMGMEYMKENYAYLKAKAKNIPITDTALYTAHFLGAYGARKFLSAPAGANVEDVVGTKAVNANASVFREPTGRRGVYGRVRTVGEALAEIDKRLHGMRGEHDLKPGQNPMVAEGSENPAMENVPQTGEGEPMGAAPETGMDTAAAQGGGGAAPTADVGGTGGDTGGGGGYGPSASSSGSGGEAPVTNASNGAPAATSTSYSQPPSPDPVAAKAAGNAILTREPDDEQGTFGKLRLPDGTEYFTLELPWRDNATGASCIPPGNYKVAIRNSPKFGRIYEVMNVPGRTAILIHSGNVAGDKSKGFNSHVEGCILLGLSKGKVGAQKAVQQSRAAIAQFNEKMGGQPFNLTVVGAGANTSAKSVADASQDEGATVVQAQDAAEAANGAASGSNAATNTQQPGTYGAQPSAVGDPTTSPSAASVPTGSTPPPTASQTSAAITQNQTAQSTMEMSQTVGPLLQKQLEYAQSMDGSLKDIRRFLEIMSQQQSIQMEEASINGEQAHLDARKANRTAEAAAAESQSSSQQTSAGSGRNPINTKRPNAVT